MVKGEIFRQLKKHHVDIKIEKKIGEYHLSIFPFCMQYLSESMQKCSGYTEQEVTDGTTEIGVLQLLLAWKNLTLILANSKVSCFVISDNISNGVIFI